MAIFRYLNNVLLWLSLCISIGALATGSLYFQIFLLIAVCLMVVRPQWGMVAFAIGMPILGGGQPGFEHTAYFLILLAGVCFGANINLILRQRRSQFASTVNGSNPLVFALLIFWIVAALSVVNVPTHGILRTFILPNPELALDLVKHYEGNGEYPWVSLINLSFYSWLFVYLYSNFKCDLKFQQRMLQGLAFGAMLTVVFGLLDYFDVLPLDSVRPIEGNAFKYERLVSFFGNPTWYAQYLVLSAPAVLSLMFFRWSRKKLLAAMLAWMVFTEFCILLINQRGGWLAYPLSLVVIWFCIYVLGLDHRQEVLSNWWYAVKKSWLKIAVSLPLTLIVSFSVIYVVAGMDESGKQHVLGFVERAGTIKNVNDRLAYLEPTLKLVKQYPILGAGSDSFRIEYEKAFMNEGHRCVHGDPYTTVSRGTAHNLYFQTLVGKGLVGLLSLFGVMAATIWLAIRGVALVSGAVRPIREQQITLMMGFAFTLAFIVYSNVGEIFYSPVNGVVFATFLAASAAAGEGVSQLGVKFRRAVLMVLSVAFLAHWIWRYFGVYSCS